jgi:polar amino acid transport system permease protein
VRWLVRIYCDIIRGIPVLVLIFTVYYGLSLLIGVDLNNFIAAVIALTVFAAAKVTETTRGAIQSIHFGQTEAGKAIGLGFWSRMAYIILPQALRRFLPPWINNVTDIVKGSALVSLVGIVELLMSMKQVIGRVYEPMPIYIVGALIYFAINYSLSSLSRRLEGRYAYIRE